VNAPFLIAGLGNPGAEYARTRHNAGFLVLEELARVWKVDWRREARFDALVARTNRPPGPVWLVRPLTYMNVTGRAVGAVARYYQVPLTQILVVVDDADLPLGTVRMRPEGSSGGHHGLESIEDHLGTRAYARLRIGIGRTDPAVREITGHVLGRFTADEAEVFGRVLPHAVEQVVCWLEEGPQKAMARYNGPVK
jgi:PTH1 family peptidyl-tRNA hydrolase